MMTPKLIISLFLVLSSFSPLLAQQKTITNPVAESGADPWIIKNNGWYYYCYSNDTSIGIKRAKRIEDALQQTGKIIFEPSPDKEYSHELWAPELHHMKNKWYVYFAADDGDNYNHRMYVLESKTEDATGEYIFKGQLELPDEKWAIDGTLLEYKDHYYFIWSGWEGDTNVVQNLYIAQLTDPFTSLGERVAISKPEYEWEMIGNPLINEGPEVLKHNDDVFVIYSASGSWTDNYCLGQLRLVGDDPMNKAHWQKKATPVFSGTSTVISPGHASFIKSPDDSEDWIVYHTARHKGAGWDRVIRIQPFTWNDNGEPCFGYPYSSGVSISAPSEN